MESNHETIILYVEGNITAFEYLFDDVNGYVEDKGLKNYTDCDGNIRVRVFKFGYVDPNFIMFLIDNEFNESKDKSKFNKSKDESKFYVYKINQIK